MSKFEWRNGDIIILNKEKTEKTLVSSLKEKIVRLKEKLNADT